MDTTDYYPVALLRLTTFDTYNIDFNFNNEAIGNIKFILDYTGTANTPRYTLVKKEIYKGISNVSMAIINPFDDPTNGSKWAYLCFHKLNTSNTEYNAGAYNFNGVGTALIVGNTYCSNAPNEDGGPGVPITLVTNLSGDISLSS